MTPQQQAAQDRINALQQQVNDAAKAADDAEKAVLAALAAQASTSTVTGHVFGAISGAVPVPATSPTTPAHPQIPVQQPTTPAAVAPATPRRRFFSTGGWNRWDWVFALIFAFVAFFIGRETRYWFADLFEFSGKPETALHIFWWVLLPFLGFFTGGWFGSSMVTKFNTWRTNRRASRQTP